MTTFNDREHGFEAKFAHDEELRFLAKARRDKLFAHWAGEQLGVPGCEIEAMTRAALNVPDDKRHDERLLAQITNAFIEHGHQVERGKLAARLDMCAAEARKQLQADQPLV